MLFDCPSVSSGSSGEEQTSHQTRSILISQDKKNFPADSIKVQQFYSQVGQMIVIHSPPCYPRALLYSCNTKMKLRSKGDH